MNEEELLRFRRGHLGRLFAELANDFMHGVLEALKDRHPGFKAAHVKVFASLPLEGARLTDVARRAGITKQSMGSLVTELEAQGYLHRQPDPGDRRATRICFSPRGRTLLEDAAEATDIIEQRYTSILGERRFRDLKSSLGDLMTGLELVVPA